MDNMESCERCDGAGVDPMQDLYVDEVALCLDCRGDGVVLAIEVVEERMLLLSA